MEDFCSFDDTLFSEKKKDATGNSQFEAHYQDPCWYLAVEPESLPPYADKLSVLKHNADYFYMNKNFKNAITYYEQMLSILPENNVVTRRECYENLARCYNKDKVHEKAVYYSHLLHKTSRTVEHLTVSLTCILDTHLSSGQYAGASLSCAKLIAIHKLNSHLWLRLAYILSCIFNVESPALVQLLKFKPEPVEHADSCEVDCCVTRTNEEFLNNCKGNNSKILVSFCLMMAKYIMVGVQGTAVGFAAASLQENINKLEHEISRLQSSCSLSRALVLELDCIVTKNVFGYDKRRDDCSEQNDGFVDRGSSKFQGDMFDTKFSTVNSYSFDDFYSEWLQNVIDML